ncbi:hypothetical protein BV210_05100 [Halorientalis sp. IM1011]|nr:hypothetical protein BV210_05100 [Halorientalis sp. IM1011]
MLIPPKSRINFDDFDMECRYVRRHGFLGIQSPIRGDKIHRRDIVTGRQLDDQILRIEADVVDEIAPLVGTLCRVRCLLGVRLATPGQHRCDGDATSS